MNKFYTCLLVILSTWANAQKQDITIQNLVECTFLSDAGFAGFAKSKGFTHFTDSASGAPLYERQYKNNKTLKHLLKRQQQVDTTAIWFQTTSHTEFMKWRQELQDNGFSFFKDKDKKEEDLYPVFQKRNIIARLNLLHQEEQTVYYLKFENIRLPDISEIRFAEDLLQLDAHEYVATVFGAGNVKQDVFYFSEQEVNKCSILFPNSSNQVIFIWKDELNKRGISFLLLGGASSNNASIYNGNLFHKWRSKQGVYLGMTLKELQQLNNEPIEFYAWETEQPGFVKNSAKGSIDLNKLGIQLQCLDCHPALTKTDIVLTSKNVLRTSDRIFVSTMMILPEKKKNR